MKFSVIVPIYNVEKYLDRCINSILKQEYADLEILLVDDESPDNCPAICEDWAKRDNRIKVIHKRNEGLGLTRNVGMTAATGDYICFIDSDDYVVDDYFSELSERLAETGFPDVGLFGYYLIGSKEVKECINFCDGKFTKSQILDILLPKAFSMSLRIPQDTFGIGSAWGGVYKKDFLISNKLFFLSEREFLSEDLLFSINVCLHANEVVFVPKCLYNYCENSQSLSHSYRRDRFDKSRILLDYMLDIINNYHLSNECITRAYENYIINMIVCFKQEVNCSKNIFEKKKEITRIVDDLHTRDTCNNYNYYDCKQTIRLLMILIKHKFYWLIMLIIKLRESIN